VFCPLPKNIKITTPTLIITNITTPKAAINLGLIGLSFLGVVPVETSEKAVASELLVGEVKALAGSSSKEDGLLETGAGGGGRAGDLAATGAGGKLTAGAGLGAGGKSTFPGGTATGGIPVFAAGGGPGGGGKLRGLLGAGAGGGENNGAFFSPCSDFPGDKVGESDDMLGVSFGVHLTLLSSVGGGGIDTPPKGFGGGAIGGGAIAGIEGFKGGGTTDGTSAFLGLGGKTSAGGAGFNGSFATSGCLGISALAIGGGGTPIALGADGVGPGLPGAENKEANTSTPVLLAFGSLVPASGFAAIGGGNGFIGGTIGLAAG
jgi:hypothetical protein